MPTAPLRVDVGPNDQLRVASPGEVIATRLEELDLDVEAFVEELGMDPDEFCDLLGGHVGIDVELAAELSRLLGGTTESWLQQQWLFWRSLAWPTSVGSEETN